MIELVVEGRVRELPGASVRRTLPTRARRRLGPFVFLDHLGPLALAPGAGIDVPPHPHIGLATVTYLVEGELHHEDSLGSDQVIRPGDVNWMSAGRGIVHSERTPAPRAGSRVHGIQSWVALPREHEESEPTFEHCPASSLPAIRRDGAELRVIAGTAFGARSPVRALWPTLYVDAELAPGAELELPEEHEERGVHVIDGVVEADGRRLEGGTLAVFGPGPARLCASGLARVLLLGGAPLDGERHVFWNFVSSSRERIEQAKADWRAGRFAPVPGETERVPLP